MTRGVFQNAVHGERERCRRRSCREEVWVSRDDTDFAEQHGTQKRQEFAVAGAIAAEAGDCAAVFVAAG